MYTMLQILNLVPYLCLVAVRQNTPQYFQPLLEMFNSIVTLSMVEVNNLSIESWIQQQGGWVSSYISDTYCIMNSQKQAMSVLLCPLLNVYM